MSTLIRTTNRQVFSKKNVFKNIVSNFALLSKVDVRLNEIELQLGADSESEELSLEEEERNQESFI